MFMFQFKIFGVSIEIMCAQKHVRRTSLAPRLKKHNLNQPPSAFAVSRNEVNKKCATPTRRLFLLVARHRRQLGHVLQQNAPALQIQNAVLAPELQLTVDAFARGADEDTELLLRDMDLGAEIGRQRA